jgi:hypothetical protein
VPVVFRSGLRGISEVECTPLTGSARGDRTQRASRPLSTHCGHTPDPAQRPLRPRPGHSEECPGAPGVGPQRSLGHQSSGGRHAAHSGRRWRYCRPDRLRTRCAHEEPRRRAVGGPSNRSRPEAPPERPSRSRPQYRELIAQGKPNFEFDRRLFWETLFRLIGAAAAGMTSLPAISPHWPIKPQGPFTVPLRGPNRHVGEP